MTKKKPIRKQLPKPRPALKKVSPAEQLRRNEKVALAKAKKDQEPWKPSRNQLAVLRAAVLHPELRGYRTQAKAVGLHESTVKMWRRDPGFRSWWNKEMLANARDFMGPALHELLRIIQSPKTSDSVKVKACKVFFEGVEKSVEPAEASTAVLLEAFGPNSRAAIAMRQGAGVTELKIAVESGPGDGLAAGQSVGAVVVTRHPEQSARLAVEVVQAAKDEERDEENEKTGKRTRGAAPLKVSVPTIVRTTNVKKGN